MFMYHVRFDTFTVSEYQSLKYLKKHLIRGLQALSVQFRFAFSKPSSSQTRFLNRLVAAPAEVAHFCRYKKLFFD